MSRSVRSQGAIGFAGLDTEAHPLTRDPQLLQVDEGGSHERQGVWQVRRGWEHAAVTKKDGPIRACVVLELANGDYVAVLGEGQNLHAEADFDG